MIQPMIVKKMWLPCSTSFDTSGSAVDSRSFASASPKNTAKNSTCSGLLVAMALMADAGTAWRQWAGST